MEDDDEDVEFYDMFDTDKNNTDNKPANQIAQEEKKDSWDEKIEVEQPTSQKNKKEPNSESNSDNEMQDALDKAIDEAAKAEIDQMD